MPARREHTRDPGFTPGQGLGRKNAVNIGETDPFIGCAGATQGVGGAITLQRDRADSGLDQAGNGSAVMNISGGEYSSALHRMQYYF